MHEDFADEETAFHAERVVIMELIKGLADELIEHSAKEPGLASNVGHLIKSLSDDMISRLYDEAVDWGVDETELKGEVAVRLSSPRMMGSSCPAI